MPEKRKPAVPIPPFKASANVSSLSRSPQLPSSRELLPFPRSSPRLSSKLIASPVLRSSDDRTRSGTELDKLRSQLELLERGLADAETQLSKQTSQLSATIMRNKELESECAKLRLHALRERVTRNAETQTVPPPVPIRMPSRLRRIDTVEKENVNALNLTVPPPAKIFTESIVTPNIATTMSPVKSVSHSSSPRGRVQGLASRFGAVKRPVSSGTRKNIPPDQTSSTGTAAKLFISQLYLEDSSVMQAVGESFDRLDGAKTGWLSRDVCLVMLSLLLEERGIRHFSIPKVICSRMLKSVVANCSRLSEPQSPRGTVLRRDQAPDFVRAALEFIIDQEKVN